MREPLASAATFIGGHRKAGTTMLLALLDGHPQLNVFPVDSGFFYAYFPVYESEGYDREARIGRILEFCFGMAIALGYRASIRLSRGASFLLVVAAFAGYAASAAFGSAGAYRVLEWGLPGAALVGGLALGPAANPDGPLARAFAFLGDASYSLYLVHMIAFLVTRRLLLPWFDHPLMPAIYAAAIAAMSIAIAILSYRYFERPVTRFLQRRIGRVAATSPA